MLSSAGLSQSAVDDDDDDDELCGKDRDWIWPACSAYVSTTAHHINTHPCTAERAYVVRPSVCPSVCLSHGWISQKRL